MEEEFLFVIHGIEEHVVVADVIISVIVVAIVIVDC